MLDRLHQETWAVSRRERRVHKECSARLIPLKLYIFINSARLESRILEGTLKTPHWARFQGGSETDKLSCLLAKLFAPSEEQVTW